jgi:hypothetical protein
VNATGISVTWSSAVSSQSGGSALIGPRAAGEHVLGAEEIRDVRRRGFSEHVFGRSLLHHAALVEHDRDVAEQPGFGKVVRHLEHGEAALVVQCAQLSPRERSRPRIERAERLVEEQHFGTPRERTCDRHQLTFAAAQRRDGPLVQIHHTEAFGDVGGDGFTQRAILHVLLNAQMRKEERVLIDNAEAPALGGRRREILAAEHDPAGRRLHDTGDRLEERRLAGAGGADHDTV